MVLEYKFTRMHGVPYNVSTICKSETARDTKEIKWGLSLFFWVCKTTTFTAAIFQCGYQLFVLRRRLLFMLFYDSTQAVQTFNIRPFFHKTYGFEAALRQGLKPLYFSPCLLQFWSSQLVTKIICWKFNSSSLLKSK